jgi:hypothetical protein
MLCERRFIASFNLSAIVLIVIVGFYFISMRSVVSDTLSALQEMRDDARGLMMCCFIFSVLWLSIDSSS